MGPQTPEPATETLRRYVHHVEQLQTRRIIQEQDLRSSLRVSADIGAPVSITHHEPDEEDLRSYLLDFRKFMAKNELVSVSRVFNVAHSHVTSEAIVHGLADARAGWKAALKTGDIRLRVNEQHVSPEFIMDLWINGWYFHNDAEKRHQLNALAEVPLSRWLFVNSVVTATKVILYSGHAIKVALREGLISEAPAR